MIIVTIGIGRSGMRHGAFSFGNPLSYEAAVGGNETVEVFIPPGRGEGATRWRPDQGGA